MSCPVLLVLMIVELVVALMTVQLKIESVCFVDSSQYSTNHEAAFYHDVPVLMTQT